MAEVAASVLAVAAKPVTCPRSFASFGQLRVMAAALGTSGHGGSAVR
jgi:hypothetical protein